MVALPGQLFYTTTIPVCLWFLRKGKPEHRRGQTLFIDARKMGYMAVSYTHLSWRRPTRSGPWPSTTRP